jgi:Outer membrane protein beta-barrel domain
MPGTRCSIAVAAVFASCLASGARADSSDVRARHQERMHAYAGLFGSAYLVAAQATDYRRGYLDHGGGGGLFAGVRLNRRFSVEARVRATVNGEHFARARVTHLPLDALVVTTVGLGGRVHLPIGSAFEPYAAASAGYAVVVADFVDCPDCDAVFAKGPQAELGGGLDLHLSPRLSAGVRAGGQVLYFGHDSFEKRLREVELEPSQTRTAILSLATDAHASFHF